MQNTQWEYGLDLISQEVQIGFLFSLINVISNDKEMNNIEFTLFNESHIIKYVYCI